jgi:hypothetical protein
VLHKDILGLRVDNEDAAGVHGKENFVGDLHVQLRLHVEEL